MSSQDDRSLIEQHAQTLISLIVAALLGWSGVTLNQLQTTMAGMVVQVGQLQNEVSNLRQLNNDRYPLTQATQDWSRNRQELDEIRTRLRAVERVGK